MRAPWELRAPAGTPWIATGIRALLLAFCAVLMALGRGSGERTSWLSALLIVAVAAALLPSRPSVARVIAAGEAVLAAAAVVYTGGADSPFLAYLPAACFGAGITIGGFGLVICAGVAAGVALLARLATLTPETSVEAYTTASAEWTVIAVTLGLPGVMVRGLGWSSTSVRSQYGEVYRLLDQLRAVTRSLPGSLDPGTAAGALLDRVRRSASAQRGAVLLYSGDRFVPLAVQGARRVPWRPSLDEPGPVSTAWAKRTAIVDRRPADLGGRRTGSALLILPLTADQRAVGLLILESSDTEAFDAAAIRAVTREAVEATPAIETAALFDELRILAATEERSRLAREMHDGIAQDLAYLGYQVDAVTRAIQLDRKDDAEKLSQELRHEMSRLTQDLRLSITDLKSSIGPARSVTAALTEYARSAGTGAGITVHLSLTEETVRLPADTEVGLLRIAHEAITAARRRPNTRNLWVTLVSDPPSFALEVADDGESGSGKTGTSARSTEIMDEIAGRIGGVLRTTRRPGGGISVHVQTRGDGS